MIKRSHRNKCGKRLTKIMNSTNEFKTQIQGQNFMGASSELARSFHIYATRTKEIWCYSNMELSWVLTKHKSQSSMCTNMVLPSSKSQANQSLTTKRIMQVLKHTILWPKFCRGTHHPTIKSIPRQMQHNQNVIQVPRTYCQNQLATNQTHRKAISRGSKHNIVCTLIPAVLSATKDRPLGVELDLLLDPPGFTSTALTFTCMAVCARDGWNCGSDLVHPAKWKTQWYPPTQQCKRAKKENKRKGRGINLLVAMTWRSGQQLLPDEAPAKWITASNLHDKINMLMSIQKSSQTVLALDLVNQGGFLAWVNHQNKQKHTYIT